MPERPSYEEGLAQLASARGSTASAEATGKDRGPEEEPAGAEADDEVAATDTLCLDAVQLGGIANLAPAEGGIELRLSAEGLDIVRDEDESLGRLTWPEVRGLSVPSTRACAVAGTGLIW